MIAAIKARATPYIFWIKLGAIALAVAAASYVLWLGYSHVKKIGYEAAKAECVAANQAAQAKADARHAWQIEVANSAVAETLLENADYAQKLRSRQNELRKVSAGLASCKLSRDVVRVLNDAGRDAEGQDRATSGAVHDAMP